MADDAARARNKRYRDTPAGREKVKALKREWSKRRWARLQEELARSRELDSAVDALVERLARPRSWRLPPEDLRWLRDLASALGPYCARTVDGQGDGR